MAGEIRHRAYVRRTSRQDMLEESRSRHEEFRSSMFSSSSRQPSNLPALAARTSSSDPDGSTSESRIDAAIRAAIAVDAKRGANTFNCMSITPQHSGAGSAFEQTEFAPYNGPHAESQDQTQATTSTGAGGGYRAFQPPSGGSGYPVRFAPPNGSVASDCVGGDDREYGSSELKPFGYGGEQGTEHRDVRNTWGWNVVNSGESKTVWDRAGGVSTPKAVWGPEHRHGFTGAMGGDDVSGGIASRALPPPREEESVESTGSSRKAGADREGISLPEWNPKTLTMYQGMEGSADDLEDGDGGTGGVALTPTSYDEPLELPDGCHHISLAKFLGVMSGPGLRVRKHHRTGKGTSGLRVLRYNEEDDTLTWDSHKILGAAQHVLPMTDVQSISMQAGNRVVLTCVGGKDSYAVFEAANDDAAAVLFVGLERLRERTAALNQ